MKKNYVGLLLAVAVSFGQFGGGAVTAYATTDNGAAAEATDENADTFTENESAASSEGDAADKDIANIDDALLDAWGKFDFTQFKVKNESSKLSFGLIAQDILSACNEMGFNLGGYNLIEENVYYENEGAEPDTRYSLRYTEALCIEAAYNRREVKRLKERLSRLEERLAS